MAVRYVAKAHFGGTAATPVDLTVQHAWVYIIACVRHRIMYVGETYDAGGLVVRLSSHFGPFPRSTLRQAAFRHAGIGTLRSPFVVAAAQLPVDNADVSFDGSNKTVRRLIEARVQEQVARFALSKAGWDVVSTSQPARERDNPDIGSASDGIAECFIEAFGFLEGVTPSSPFHLVILVADRGEPGDLDPAELINKIEVILFDKIVSALEAAHGDDWWGAVPEGIRVDCATKKERERESAGEDVPPQAYLTFIDLRTIIEKNWQTFGSLMEDISGRKGKRSATSWMVEVNELRNRWAHPIKQRFVETAPVSVARLQGYLQALQTVHTP
ncbi:MAG: Swt1 family HEPN domain-containing protein [Rhodospirillales bacterium]|nr:Swt1 family HEPN domain-containing protein [Rhodospirillales bacterium]